MRACCHIELEEEEEEEGFHKILIVCCGSGPLHNLFAPADVLQVSKSGVSPSRSGKFVAIRCDDMLTASLVQLNVVLLYTVAAHDNA